MILTDMWSTMIKEHWSVLTYVHILSSDTVLLCTHTCPSNEAQSNKLGDVCIAQHFWCIFSVTLSKF